MYTLKDIINEEVSAYPTVHIIVNDNHDDGYLNVWENVFDVIDGYNVNIIRGPDIKNKQLFLQDAYSKAYQLQKICDAFHDGIIQDGDTIIFADIWHFAIPVINYLRIKDSIRLKVIAFYANSFFTKGFTGEKWKKFYSTDLDRHPGVGWAKMYEQSLLYGVNFACVFSPVVASLHNYRYYPLTNNKPIFVTGLPLEALYLYGQDVNYSFKENLIIFPFGKKTERGSILAAVLARLRPDWKIVFPAEENLSRDDYRRLLLKAKIVFLTDAEDLNLTCIYDALCCGTYPVMPSTRFFAKIEPRFCFNVKWLKTKKFLQLFRLGSEIEKYFLDILDNYEHKINIINDVKETLRTKYFKNDLFLKILQADEAADILEFEFLHEVKSRNRTEYKNRRKK